MCKGKNLVVQFKDMPLQRVIKIFEETYYLIFGTDRYNKNDIRNLAGAGAELKVRGRLQVFRRLRR